MGGAACLTGDIEQPPATIAAIATPLGEGGIGIVRISGPRATEIALRLFRPASGGPRGMWCGDPPPARRVILGDVADPEDGSLLDQCLLTRFQTPASFTGEDVVELACHGSPAVLRQVLLCAIRLGARLARPGEFTQRAFLNGRLDLATAEAVIDVITAQTAAAARLAVAQMSGALSRAIRGLRADLIALLAEIEAAIDFPEEVEPPPDDELAARASRVRDEAESLLRSGDVGRLYREGAAVVLAGRPNAGKSSLLNALLGEDRAIVADLPGTTRDVIEEALNLDGVPIRAIDTAGIRDAAEPVERLGVERTEAQISGADLIVWVLDATQGCTPLDADRLAGIADRPLVIAWNKADAAPGRPPRPVDFGLPAATPLVPLSALTGAGLDELRRALAACLLSGRAAHESVVVSNVRHLEALMRTRECLDRAIDAARDGFHQAAIALDLRLAAEALGEITGESVTEAMIDQIFARFCVGK